MTMLESKQRAKLGIILNLADTFFHYRNILQYLNPRDFEIVMAGEPELLSTLLQKYGYRHIYYKDLLQTQQPYAFTLSSYYGYYYDRIEEGEARGRIYLPQILGARNIRLMYALGKDYWNYADWNHIYDYHLCFGPWQRQRLEAFSSQVFEVGYPRYDDYFGSDLALDKWRKQWALAENKTTLVWLPTRYQHSIREFIAEITLLPESYQILIKPHPATAVEEPEVIDLIQAYPRLRLIQETVDNLYLFALADFVLTDYGGPQFGAVYTDQKLVLLDLPPDRSFEPQLLPLPEGNRADLSSLNPSERYLRKFIPHLLPEQAGQLPHLLTDQRLWKRQKRQRQRLRQQFFAPYYGHSAQRVADILQEIIPL